MQEYVLDVAIPLVNMLESAKLSSHFNPEGGSIEFAQQALAMCLLIFLLKDVIGPFSA